MSSIDMDFAKFWKYYNATSRTDYSGYRKLFFSAFSDALVDLDMKDWRYPGNWPSTVAVKKNLTKICTKVRVKMISKGVPAGAATQILTSFKKWIKEY